MASATWWINTVGDRQERMSRVVAEMRQRRYVPRVEAKFDDPPQISWPEETQRIFRQMNRDLIRQATGTYEPPPVDPPEPVPPEPVKPVEPWTGARKLDLD